MEFIEKHTPQEVLQFICSSKSKAQKEASFQAKQEIQYMQDLQEILDIQEESPPAEQVLEIADIYK